MPAGPNIPAPRRSESPRATFPAQEEGEPLAQHGGVPPRGGRAAGKGSGRRTATVDLAALAALGGGIAALALWMGSWEVISEDPWRFSAALLALLALYAAASAWVIRRRPPTRWALALVLLVALVGRLAFLADAPSLSDDMYRYIWDGRMQAHGINPYQYAPADAALAPYRDETIYPRINRRAVPTIYPPVAQALFRVLYAIYPDSVTWTKLALVLVDLLTIGVVAALLARLRLRPERALLYAWHPLLFLEIGHSGHLDGVVVLFLVLALWARLAARPVLGGVLLAAATLVKLYALVVLPALLRPDRPRDPRVPLALAAAIALAYLPFLSAGVQVLGYLPGYIAEEGLASGQRYYLLKRTLALASPEVLAPSSAPLDAAPAYRVLVLGVMVALALWCWLRPIGSPRQVATRALLLCLALLVLATPSYPWYRLLLLAFVPFASGPLALAASFAVAVAPFIYLHWWLPGLPTWPDDLVYLGSAAALAGAGLWAGVRRLRAGARPVEGQPST